MISLTPWLGVTIFGFVYVTAGVFLFLSYAGEYRLGFLKHAQPYAPYLAVLVLFLSYLVGLVAHLLSQQVWVAFFHSADAYNARRLIALQADTPRDLLTSLGNSYDTMVIYRHLWPAFVFLGISLYAWLDGYAFRRLRWSSLIGCLLLALFFFYVWRVVRGQYLDLLDMSHQYLH